MNWYIKVLENYIGFTGRARRSEYWFFTLFNMLFGIIAMVLDNVLGIAINEVGYGPIYGIYALSVLIPGLGVTVRRLHDVGKSGWMALIVLIPLIGSIWLLVLLATDSVSGANEYGPNPKGIGENNEFEVVENEVASGDKIITLVIVWFLISTVFYTVLNNFSYDLYSTTWFRIVNAFTRLIWAAIPVGLAFAVKDTSKKTLLFILGGVCCLIGVSKMIYELYLQFF